MGTVGALNGAPKAPFPGRAREIPPKAGISRVFFKCLKKINVYSTKKFENIKNVNTNFKSGHINMKMRNVLKNEKSTINQDINHSQQ